MGQDRSRGEGLLQEVEGGATIGGKFPRNVFAGKPRERNDNVGVVVDEATVEVRETEEGLDVLHLAGFWPIGDGFDLVGGHGESVGRKAESEVFGGGGVEFTFLRLGEEIVFPEALEDFADMFLMGFNILGVDQDVI